MAGLTRYRRTDDTSERATAAVSAGAAGGRVCQRCGFASPTAAPFCRRCGLPFGAAPIVEAADWPPECPVCYAQPGRDGSFPAAGGARTTYEQHAYHHERHPVGDDDYLESLRDGDEIRIGRWRAPFELTRRYLVTGRWEGGRARGYAHNAVVLAMVATSRAADEDSPAPAAGGPAPTLGSGNAPRDGADSYPTDLAEARAAVTELMERYHGETRPVRRRFGEGRRS